jgi:hypothetical protein
MAEKENTMKQLFSAYLSNERLASSNASRHFACYAESGLPG